MELIRSMDSNSGQFSVKGGSVGLILEVYVSRDLNVWFYLSSYLVCRVFDITRDS